MNLEQQIINGKVINGKQFLDRVLLGIYVMRMDLIIFPFLIK